MAKMSDTNTQNRQREAWQFRRVYEQAEYLESKARILEETVHLEQKRLDDRRQAKVDKLDQKLRRKLYREELLVSDPKKTAKERYQTLLPRLQKKQRLFYLKSRQDLRRSEGLLDKAGRVTKDGSLSPDAQKKLDGLLALQEEERKALENKALDEALQNQLPQKERAQRMARYKQRMEDKARRLNQLDQTLKVKDIQRMNAFTMRQENAVRSLKQKLEAKQRQLLEGRKALGHTLPPDVCLRLDGLSMVFGGLTAVDKLSVDIMKGEIFGLIGPNGAGKTTVFNCITQFYKPTAGDILFRTRKGNVLRLNDYPVHSIIRKGIVRTFQNVEVIGELSILDNLLIAAHPQYHASLFSQMFSTHRVRQEESVMRERAIKVLEYCGLAALRDLPPVGQPYGILKRIELARTLMANASLIILDEPAAGLNDQETVELTHLIRRVQQELKVTVFVVEHNMGLIMDICDHICVISFGKKLAYGTPAQIQSDPVVQEAYLGTNDAGESEAV